MKKWLVFVWILALLMQAVPIAAAESAVLRIEGEDYTYVNQTPVNKTERDKTNVKTTEISNQDHFQYKSANATLPENGYIVDYTFTAPEAGTYTLEIMASPLSNSNHSPYELKVNDGEYAAVTTATAVKVGQINTPVNIFYRYKLQPVVLKEGSNTISFRILNGRSADGRVFFFLDYFELVKLPWELTRITANAPNHIFEEQDTKEVTVHFTEGAQTVHQLVYSVTDYYGASVLSGNVALAPGAAAYTFTLPPLPRGHYTVTAEADGSGKPLQEYLSVVMNESQRRSYAETPFASDVAGGFLVPVDKIGDYARALRLTGVKYARERLPWGNISATQGTDDFSLYDQYNAAYAANGIRVLEMGHSAPAWVKDTGKKLPNDLLAAYQYAKTASTRYGAQADWEFWNEPDISYTADSETADQYAAYLKASALGVRDAGTSSLISMAGIAYPPGNYVSQVMQNDVAPYMDIYNFHGHRKGDSELKLVDLPPTFTLNKAFIEGYDLEDKRIYATEVGVSQMFQDSTETLTMEQLRKQARYLSTSAVESLALGVDKHFWFVFPHYLEKGLSWGEFTAQHTPFAGINAQSAITHALGEGIYMGSLAGLPEGVKNHVFRDGTDSVVAFWSETGIPFVLEAGYSSGLLTDIMGNEGTVLSDQGNFALASGPDIQYLRLQGDVGGLTTPYYSQSFEPRAELTPAERVVLTQRYPDAGSEKAKAKGYLLDRTAVTDIQVDVYNFNAVPMSGVITGSAYGGWSLSTPSQPVTVAPYSKETLVFPLTASSQGVVPVGSPVVFTGEFDGQQTSKTMAIVSSGDDVAGPDVLVPDYDQPGLWDNNVSPGSTMVKHSPEPGVIQFDLQMGDGDRWAYPNFVLPENISFAGTEGVVFDVYFPAPVPGVLVRSFMYESNGSSYFTQTGMTPTGGWQQFKMSWSDFNPFGGVPDDNFHLDPEEIRSFSLGLNTSTEKNLSFQVKNLGVYTQADTGLYSKLSGLQPANGQEVTAGTAAISANLAQGEIPVQAETVQVLVDKTPVAHQADGELIQATAHLAAGSHDIMVKAFDVNGRLISVKSTVTAVAAEPEEPGTGEPGTEEPGIEQPEQPGTEEPGTEQPGTEEPDTEASTVANTAPAGNTPEVLKVLPEHLQAAGDQALSLTLPQGKTRVELGKELFGKLDGKELNVELDKSRLVIPAETIRELIGSKGDIQRIIIVASEQGEAAREQAAGLAKAQSIWGGSLSEAGGALELSLYAVDSAGLQVKPESFAAPVAVSFFYGGNGAARAEQTGIYYWNEATGLPEYVRSIRDPGESVLTASLDHSGAYMLLAYDKTYADVPGGHWASKAIRGLTAAHVVEGDDSGRFAPDRAVSRAEFITLLARLLELEKRTGTAPLSESSFADVSSTDYYAQAVEAVRKAGIADGRGEGYFAPDAVITREEMAVLLTRAMRFAGYGMPSGGEASGGPGFADAAAVSPWALPDVEAAAAAGWLGGYEDGAFRPQGSATRAEAAQLLWKLGEAAPL
ncbi:S-layer homology domain-containing protein [Paenibacillus sp. YN15]|uniref:S-layer homology domain-containing protein n=1 Tax=Paenibacillus sp. YN15 TaxID=1742774 RepID=UPI000DCDAD74|nr:S-layer homology domain-containing protein [Paenibacillus sp. YN15]RAV00993.1 hypothetical protein DQG13_13405 [Paenibacillus sp. YN15]